MRKQWGGEFCVVAYIRGCWGLMWSGLDSCRIPKVIDFGTRHQGAVDSWQPFLDQLTVLSEYRENVLFSLLMSGLNYMPSNGVSSYFSQHGSEVDAFLTWPVSIRVTQVSSYRWAVGIDHQFVAAVLHPCTLVY